jgi:large subunit ribosomal protein L30
MWRSFAARRSKSYYDNEEGTFVAKLQITLKRSLIGRPEDQRVTVRTLGLRKMHQSVVQNDNPAIRGMVNKVIHLVDVKEVE